MNELPRKRGRPSKADLAARQAQEAAQAAAYEASPQAAEETFLDELIAQPVTRRKTKIQPTEENLRIIHSIAKLAGSHAEIASCLGIAERTFRDFLNFYPEAREAYETGIDKCKVSLRRKQFQLADKNAPMAIFLGKNLLGQKDENHNINTTVGAQPAQLTNEQLMEIIEAGKTGQTAKGAGPVH